jgi:four helix bundle protein
MMANTSLTNMGRFPFEDLDVWHDAVIFAEKCLKIVEDIKVGRKHYRLIEQFESATASPALNIAEGKGRYSKKEFVQFLYIARGSLFETVTLLTIFHRQNWINDSILNDLKEDALVLVKKLNSLIKSIKG